ncbi:MAG: hypothetical protein J0H42_00695 [Rhizobiales bacterium]|nr:hypothetical protein [Hyphomicrobiales bacterium]
MSGAMGGEWIRSVEGGPEAFRYTRSGVLHFSVPKGMPEPVTETRRLKHGEGVVIGLFVATIATAVSSASGAAGATTTWHSTPSGRSGVWRAGRAFVNIPLMFAVLP